MSTTGSLSDFSLPEIFKFLESSKRTGLLTFQIPTSLATPASLHYVWVFQGSLVAAAHQLNHFGLVSLITQYQWVSDRVVTKLAQFCPPHQPFGFYLRSQGVLQTVQLEHLFQIQIVQELCPLLTVEDALFRFDQTVSLPKQEMTGLNVSGVALELMLQKILWLQKRFKAKEKLREKRGLTSKNETFCNQLSLILNTAFFHSLNFSLLEVNSSFTKLSYVLEVCDRAYDLPKIKDMSRVCCTGR